MTNAVRCVPPANLPKPQEIGTCNRFLAAEMAAMPRLACVLALGGVAHAAVLRAQRPARQPCALPARRGARAAGQAASGRQLSCVAAQHEYRPADDRNVRGGGAGRADASGVRLPPPVRGGGRWEARRCCAVGPSPSTLRVSTSPAKRERCTWRYHFIYEIYIECVLLPV